MATIEELDKRVKRINDYGSSPEAIFSNEFQNWWWINSSKYEEIDSRGHIKQTSYSDWRDWYFEKLWKPKCGPEYAKEFHFPKDYNKRIERYIATVKREGRLR